MNDEWVKKTAPAPSEMPTSQAAALADDIEENEEEEAKEEDAEVQDVE